MRDFEVYWTAASRAAHAEPLYRTADGHYQFKYLPAFAVLMAPASLVSLPTAKALWFIASSALIPVLVALSIALLPERRRPVWLLSLVAVVAMGKFFGHELVLGQVNILFAVLTCAGTLLMIARHDAASAALFVLAIAVKPYAVIFLPWIAAARGRRALAAAAVGLVGLVAIPALLYGIPQTIDLHRQWWLTVTASTAPNLTNNDNVSLAGMYAKWLGQGPSSSTAAAVTGGALLALDFVVIVSRRHVPRPEPLEFALLLMLVPLLSPQGWDYVFLVATPAVVLLANADERLPPVPRSITWIALAVIGLSLFDVMGRERYATFMSWSILTWCFVWLTVAVSMLRLRRIA